jgi:hypothetical protein
VFEWCVLVIVDKKPLSETNPSEVNI